MSLWMQRPTVTDKRPNLLIIIADDLGYTDVGCYGSEIHTPRIDKLAEDGVRMLDFHSASACSPTRAMVLTGTDAHLCGLGCIIEQRRDDKTRARVGGKPGYEGYLTKEVAPLSEILEDQGYYTVLSGKWHLGMRNDHLPNARGFKRSFTHLPGCSNHWGWEPVLHGNYRAMPIGGRPVHAEDGKAFHVKPNKTQDPEGFYSSKTYADKMIQYLDEREPVDMEKPFFAYLAFTATHWPLHCSKGVREKYKGVYKDGPAALREKRLKTLKEMGIISEDVVPHPVIHPDDPEWEQFNEYEQACSSRAMEAYAGMVEEMDTAIGRVIDRLKETNEYDDTMIVFMSDNGAEGASFEARPTMNGDLRKIIPRYFDNSLDNIGNWNSYTWLGPLWASASTAPSRLFKCFTAEGGIKVPAVVKYPQGGAGNPKWNSGGFNRSFTTCMDVVPTFLDLINARLPTQIGPDGVSKMVHRRQLVHGTMGKSWHPYIAHSRSGGGDTEFDAIYTRDDPVGWALMSCMALRKGDWKIVYLPKKFKGRADPAKGSYDPKGWELFNLRVDPGETDDLADSDPTKLAEMQEAYNTYAKQVGVAWGPTADEPGIWANDAPWLYDDDETWQRAWLQTPGGQRVSYDTYKPDNH